MNKPLRTQKHSINLREGDYAAIQDFVHQRPIRASDVIRKLVSSYVDKVINAPMDDRELSKIKLFEEDNND